MPLIDKNHCPQCKKGTNSEKDIRCGKCNMYFHSTCSGLTRAELQSIMSKSAHNLSYICDYCYPPKTGNNQDERLIEKLSAEMKKLIKCELNDITKALDFFSKKIDDYEEEKKSIFQKIKEVQLENKNLRHLVNQSLQNCIETSLEINGIETKKEENPKIPVECIFKKIGCEELLNNNSIINVYTNSLKKTITIKMATKELKERIITQKKKAGYFSAKDINHSTSVNPIYINEKLTPQSKQLLWLARSTKSIGYQYAWTKNGNVLLRKNKDSPIIYVKDASDIPLQ